MKVDILIPVRNQYLLFRQLIESITHNIPDKEIGKIIVVDDHSNEKVLKRYEEYLARKGVIHLVRNGIPLPSYYSRIPISFLKSKGASVLQLPERIEFVKSIPLTNIGKADKRALRDDIEKRLGTLEHI